MIDVLVREGLRSAPPAPSEQGGQDPAPQPGSVVVQGPGGTGKTVLLNEIANGYRRSGLTVIDGHSDAHNVCWSPETGAGFAVVLDDGERVTDETADRVGRLLRLSGCSLAIAFRPVPRPRALRRLLDELGSNRRTVVLGHADRQLVHGWARDQLGAAVPPALVDAVLHQTGGLPALVHPMLRGLARTAAGSRPDSAGTGPAALDPRTVPGPVVELVRDVVVGLEEETRLLLHCVAAGAPLDEDILADLLELPSGRLGPVLTEARATGLLLGSGAVVPLVRTALLDLTPADLTRSVRRRLLGLLVERGDEPLELARALARGRVRDARAAELLVRHGSRALTADPVLAEALLGEAVATGAPAGGLAARRALAAALRGGFDDALQWVDAVMTDETVPDRPRAASVAAAVLARRGLLSRSAELYRLAGAQHAGSRALALLATGEVEEAAAILGASAQGDGGSCPSILTGCEELMARGVLQSLRSGPDACADIAAALSTLTRASTLLEPIGRTALLMDTPAALAALVALHSGELGVAEAGLRRAVAADVGGAPDRARHLLLLAWVDMLRGRVAQARDNARRAQAAAPSAMEPRDELVLHALEVGLARRTGDGPALLAAWTRAREALLRYPIDLFTLLPLGELMIAGVRLADSERIAPNVAQAQAILARAGDPQLWATPLHWSGAQAAIMADDPAALRPHAAALLAAARTSPYAAVLARAGRCWLRVLTGDIDAPTVESTAQELAAVGLSWDGSRLAGQAAARTVDPRARTALLSCARALTEASGDVAPCPVPPTAEGGTPVPTGGRLSDREREVAELVLAGQTYREIGARLFISAKTVEHHVSRMRQRLGASNRSDLLARLRAELAPEE
ncbi:helix-turn-helix transcriptional regulator [Blastococcus tunisiensis]|uniref:AAA ATPase domain-containing protein n=1 Tax=Blastococcus tunisiensis TaxID=1798228 RepID=A0A1I2FHD6_9ACTN|nr:LuxR family transcriptional regulator [Blastococcus sp. DSM 46838]SFF04685.1 AAA ATPase domain-containing protein [Blastococcus sp. DSM 46838]